MNQGCLHFALTKVGNNTSYTVPYCKHLTLSSEKKVLTVTHCSCFWGPLWK